MAEESSSDDDTKTLASKLNIKKVVVDSGVEKDQTLLRHKSPPLKKRRLVNVKTTLYMTDPKDYNS